MKAQPLETDIYQGNETFVESLSYDLEDLKIIVVATNSIKIEVSFNQPIGFRCLDEGDLLEFWKQDVITSNWILQIFESGWLDQESMRPGFGAGDKDLKEYLVKGNNDCISALDYRLPEMWELRNAL